MSELLNAEELHILQHSLGLDRFGRGQSYRNRFVTDPANPDGQKIQRLISLGYMADRGAQTLAGGMHCYMVTTAGVEAVALQSPKPPKLTASQRRWQRYREADFFENFRQFLAWEGRENRAKKLGFSSGDEMDRYYSTFEMEGGAA